MSMTMGQNLFRSVQKHSRTMAQSILQELQDPENHHLGPHPLKTSYPSQVPSTSPKMRATIILATLGAFLLISSSSATPLVIKLEFCGVFKNYCGQRDEPCDGISATATSLLGDAPK
ncbi:hypothetical protein BKA57DRAFT_508676 [Linnemannia elongata]|nr:hypothetical protein BKA57DRAFT_508676 [Linnemannia elongata]